MFWIEMLKTIVRWCFIFANPGSAMGLVIFLAALSSPAYEQTHTTAQAFCTDCWTHDRQIERIFVDSKSINNKISCSKKIQSGTASFYGKKDGFAGKRTASGEKMSPYLLTAAHPYLPLQSLVLVQDAETGAEVVVRINDRGPYAEGRVIDLSPAAARKLHVSEDKGLLKVRLFLCHRLTSPLEPP